MGYEIINLGGDHSINPQDYNTCPNYVMCNCGINVGPGCEVDILCSCPVDGFCGDVECAPNYGACGTRTILR